MDQLTITICNQKVSECLIQGTKFLFGLPCKYFLFIQPNERKRDLTSFDTNNVNVHHYTVITIDLCLKF